MAKTVGQLREMKRKDLDALHDELASNTQDSLNAVRDELHHREIRNYAKATTWMTGIITAMTVLNVILWALK